MRKFVVILLLFIVMKGFCPETTFRTIKVKKYSETDLLVKAIGYVESRHCLTAINPKEGAHGFLQIRKCVVTDVNRAFETSYKVTDALDSIAAVDIFYKYQAIYNRKFDLEKAARIWNGGPIGYKKSKTKKYWGAVFRKYVEYKKHNTQLIIVRK